MKVRARRKATRKSGCLICGEAVIYAQQSSGHTCVVCGGVFESNAACKAGHYVCDKCHTSVDFLTIIRNTQEKDPLKLFLHISELPNVHMHGPEHHMIVPCVMLAAFRNNGGRINLDEASDTAVKRAGQVPGGTCGYWGACGAAVGAGIYASILTGSNPLNTTVWDVPQRLTAECLDRLSEIGGPRCCKRTSRAVIELAAKFTKERYEVEMPLSHPPCTFFAENRECLHKRCPYYGGAAEYNSAGKVVISRCGNA